MLLTRSLFTYIINITMYELVRTQLYLNMVHGVIFTINYMFRPLYWPSSGLHYA